ncbi:carbohydrate kinase [Mortierella sp. GBAus27b]|nr:hypothetical protein BGX31_008536 [Mortierella sp. GBA43]KAI8357394.1 carbohydrate kinase [Mortierella sp. GBAus27b]
MSTLSQRQREAAEVPAYPHYRSLVPPLSANLHKGQGGRVAILGGSSDYTGAPYFSGMSALRLGADICHIICDESAATAIKSYSPDLMVHPYIRIRATEDLPEEKLNPIWAQTFDDIGALLKRVHVLVVGPGLSRDQRMLQSAEHAIQKAKELNMPIVIDADGLFMIQSNPELIHGYSKAVLTPNVAEFDRLCSSKDIDSKDQSSDEAPVQKLSQAYGGAIVIQKGSVDAISDGNTLYAVANEGGQKRSGGQGDILTGLIATSLAWSVAYEKDIWEHDHSVPQNMITMIACFGACVLNRECSKLAFEKHGRAVLASDVISEIGPLFVTFYDKARPKAGWGEALYG